MKPTNKDAPAVALALDTDPFGHLQLRLSDGRMLPVTPVRAFPLADPGAHIALVGPDGHEAAWVERLDALAEPAATLLRAALAERDFVPVVQRLVAVSTFSTPSEWTVETDRGTTTFTLKAEEDIRRLADGGLLITSAQGLCLRVAQRTGLDRASRRLLERFL